MNASQATASFDDVELPVEVASYVRTAMRFAIGITLMYGAFCVFTLLLWSWLAALLALLLAVFAERTVLTLADKHIDVAAKHTADAIVSGYGWVRSTFFAKKS